jgi:hypothetical protein
MSIRVLECDQLEAGLMLQGGIEASEAANPRVLLELITARFLRNQPTRTKYEI